MTTTAAGPIAKAEVMIGTMIANCTAFQTWTGEATAADALTHVYYDAVPMDDQHADSATMPNAVSSRPFCLLWTSFEEGLTIDKANVTSGSVVARFCQNTSFAAEDDWEEGMRLFKNTLGQIFLSEDESNPGMWELSRTGSYTHINFTKLLSYWRASEDEYGTQGDWLAAEFLISWGVSQ